jgi:hypothetical protein
MVSGAVLAEAHATSTTAVAEREPELFMLRRRWRPRTGG